MKLLVIGGGGREHALVWKLAQHHKVDKIYCIPGNGGIAEIAECIDVDINDFASIISFARYEWIDFTVVGPEAPLAAGIVDAFNKEDLPIFGPNKLASQLESSKVFAKEFMRRYRIPTAEYQIFTSYSQAEQYLRLKGAPIVIKADGLAAGKGVFVASNTQEAIDALKLIMKDRAFGSAGDRVIIEDCLVGEEASFMAFTDGRTLIPIASSQDHKRAFDNDQGPNTGGMGAYSPAPIITPKMQKTVMQVIMLPMIRNLRKEGIRFKGLLYAGLMISDGKPYVLEFNCRFGDPEAQVILPRLKTDLIDIMRACHEEKLDKIWINWSEQVSLCVVMASDGYPNAYEKGKIIHGLDQVAQMKGVHVFHGGTTVHNNQIVTSGGRVLGVTAMGDTFEEARRKVYEGVNEIYWDKCFYRHDIGFRALDKMKSEENVLEF
jgi:phosphoribosylamine--glycine ligase